MSKQGVGRYFSFIKNKVSSDWKDLAWHLGFETPDIENIEGKHRDDKSCCMDLLQQWYKMRGNAATIHVLMEALTDARLQHVVDSVKEEYPELCCTDPDLPVYVQLGMANQTSAQGQTGDISKQVSERILELERTLFTPEVLNDPVRYRRVKKLFKKHKALLKRSLKGSVIFLLTFLRQTDVDRFYHNHYRVGEGSLSQQLSHILISEHLQDKVKGAQLIVRLQVKHEDYVRVRGRLGRGLDRTTSVDNLLALPPPSRPMDHSSLSSLDLAVVGREDQPCSDDITTLHRQVQSDVQTTKEKSKEEVKVQLQTMQGQVLTGRQGVDALMKEVKMLREKNEQAEKILLEQKAEMNEKIKQLQETNKNMKAMIEELLTAKQPGESGSQKKDLQLKSDKPSMKQSAVQPKGTGTSARIKEGQEWVRKVRFSGGGSGLGKFIIDPYGVTVSQDNEVYIADWSNSGIRVFTMDGVYIREFTTTLPGETGKKLKPLDVAVDRNDNVWVVGKDHVVQYSREGKCVAKMDIPRVGYDRGITVAMATEQVIVTEYDGQNGQLRSLDKDGSEVDIFGSGHMITEPWWPRYVTVDGEGNIMVTDGNNHCVHVLDREGNFKFKFGSEGSDESQFNFPQGICVDAKGNIIVADKENHCVKMFDSKGRFLCYVATSMKWPCAIAMSPGGDVVVTDWQDNTVSVWTQG